MSDVFISYAREDYDTANKLARAFGDLGWSVWWDRNIVTGQAFDRAIEAQLESAKSVVVLWSRHSIESEWVKNEAAAAAERGVLVPASIEGVKLPLEFRRKQTADLTGWDGEVSHGGFEAVREGVANLMGVKVQAAEKRAQKSGWKVWLLVPALAVAVGLILLWLGYRRTDSWDAARMGGIAKTASTAGLADLVSGTYEGSVIADAKGSSRSDVRVTVQKIERNTVRVTSDYERLGSVEVSLTRTDESNILNVDGDTVFHVYLEHDPHKLELSVHNEVSYEGTERKQAVK